mgnify:FL=1
MQLGAAYGDYNALKRVVRQMKREGLWRFPSHATLVVN